MIVYLIEDDDIQADYWTRHIKEEYPEAIVEWFEDPEDAYNFGGNPDAIIFDVGSIGLREEAVTYFSAFQNLRNTFPDVWFYLISGIASLPEMVMEEYGEEDDLLVCLTMGRGGPYYGFTEHWNKYS